MPKYSWRGLAETIGIISIVVGLILVAYELRQNSQLMRAQVFNERSTQGIEVFLAVAESRELSEIDAELADAGFPDDPTAFSQLSSTQRRQYAWFVRANRFRIENALYQQLIGVMEYDRGHISGAKDLLKKYEAMGPDDTVVRGHASTGRLRRLLAQVEDMYEESI